MCCGSGRGAGVAGAYVFVVFECPRVSLPTKLVFSRDVLRRRSGGGLGCSKACSIA